MAELECIAGLHDLLGDEAWTDPASCSEFIQNGSTAFVDNDAGKGTRGKGKGKGGKYSG